MTALVALRVPQQWSCIDEVRAAISEAVTAKYGAEELAHALGMVSAELLENALKYGAPDPRGVLVELAERTLPQGRELQLSITHALDEQGAHLAQLQRTIAWINAFPSAADAYRAALSQVYERSDRGPIEGGLGLVRIVYEGGCTLECERLTGGTIRVLARCQIPLRAR